MQTTIVGEDASTQSSRSRFRRNSPVTPRTLSRNGAAAVLENGVAARGRTPLASPGEPGNGNGNGNRALIAALVNSRIYREYEQAFTNLTGLPVALQPVETWQLPHHGKRGEN